MNTKPMRPAPPVRPRKTQIRPSMLLSAVLLCLLAAGTLLFTLVGERLLYLQYPRRYEEYVQYYADKYEMDPLILYAFIRTESNFDPDAESDVGARGLMQITEPTFDWIKGNIAPDEPLTFDDAFDPELSVRFGSYFVKYCLARYQNDLATAAAGYHSGWGTVDDLLADDRFTDDGQTLTGFPYEQMGLYVKKITASYHWYQRLYGDETD